MDLGAVRIQGLCDKRERPVRAVHHVESARRHLPMVLWRAHLGVGHACGALHVAILRRRRIVLVLLKLVKL